MSDNSIYSQVILSKTGLEIPVFKSGKTVDSRYDPERESQRLLEQIKDDSHFLIVTGIASGILIKTILKDRPQTFILAVENSQEDIDLLKGLKIVNELSNDKRVCFTTVDSLKDKITELYVPAFYGNLQVIEQRGWTLENTGLIETINKSINMATGIVSADFSVQSHFGKLWQHNILNNIKHLDKSQSIGNLPVEKTALIVAAGPTLDKTIQTIKNDLSKYFIIATDTALSILNSYGIIPQAVISIDGQNVSNIHFIHNTKSEFSQTLFLFDLCANSSAVNMVLKNSNKVCLFTSGHPLSEYLNRHFSLGLPSLFSGAGTVTISAVDFAIKAGFKNIKIAGADFSYSNGKPYAKGTYLDRLYNQKSNKINSAQKQFSALEFRTPLIAKNDTFTTQILDAYRTSFENFLNNTGCTFIKENDLYVISNNQNKQYDFNIISQNKINGEQILKELQIVFNSKKSSPVFNSIFDLSESDISLLPLISWLRNHDNKDRSDFSYFYDKALMIYRGLGGN